MEVKRGKDINERGEFFCPIARSGMPFMWGVRI